MAFQNKTSHERPIAAETSEAANSASRGQQAKTHRMFRCVQGKPLLGDSVLMQNETGAAVKTRKGVS